MAKYRNITGQELWVQVGPQLRKIPPAGIFDDEDCGQYFQTGDTGEIPLFERVGKPTKGSPATPATADTEGDN